MEKKLQSGQTAAALEGETPSLLGADIPPGHGAVGNPSLVSRRWRLLLNYNVVSRRVRCRPQLSLRYHASELGSLPSAPRRRALRDVVTRVSDESSESKRKAAINFSAVDRFLGWAVALGKAIAAKLGRHAKPKKAQAILRVMLYEHYQVSESDGAFFEFHGLPNVEIQRRWPAVGAM